MNNNFGYYPSNNIDGLDYNMLFKTFGVDNNSGSNPSNLYGPYEGYIKGNLFKDLYQQYKDYKPQNITPKSEKDNFLLNLNQMHFAMHEMNLYLDVFPDDNNMLQKYKEFRNEYNKLINDYQMKYGALKVNDMNLNDVPFGWEEQSWPWDRRGA